MRTKFSNLLDYFGEEPSMAPHDFFATLSKFIQEFVASRDKVDRKRKLEAKDAAAKEAMALGRARRSSVVTPAAESKVITGCMWDFLLIHNTLVVPGCQGLKHRRYLRC